MKVVFHEFFKSHKGRKLLGCPHVWLGEAYEAPMQYCFEEMEKRGIHAYLSTDIPLEEADLFVFWEQPREGDAVFAFASKSGKPMFLIATESPSIVPDNYRKEKTAFYDRIFAWHSCYQQDPRARKIRPIYFQIQKPLNGQNFAKRKLAVLVGSISKNRREPGELYSKRQDILEWFEKNARENLDFYGRKNSYTNTDFSCYCGPVENKLQVMAGYRFSICFENNGITPEYITEKIFDCFFAGCVPIYLGAPDVERWIPKKCYVDPKDFEGWGELYEYLHEMKEEEWEVYRKEARLFLASEFAASYGESSFAQVLIQELICFKDL